MSPKTKSPQKKTPMPMETPGFGWRVSISILVFFGWIIFLIVWLLFYAGNFSGYQNLAVIIVSILLGIAILGASWASWGVKYGYKHRNRWEEECK